MGKRFARSDEISIDQFTTHYGIDPARSRDWFTRTVTALSRVVTQPIWLPQIVHMDRHRGMRMPDALRDLTSSMEPGGACERFAGFTSMCIDATHDPTLAETLEERYPARVEAFIYTQKSKEALYRDMWLWFQLGGRLPGKTGSRAFDECIRLARVEIERMRLEVMPNGKLRVDHHPGEHDDLVDSIMLSLRKPMQIVRRKLGGIRAVARAASGNWREDPLLATIADRARGPYVDGTMGGRAKRWSV